MNQITCSLNRKISLILGSVTLGLLLSFRPTDSSQPTFTEGANPIPEGAKWVAVKALSDEFEGKKLNTRKWTADPAFWWTNPNNDKEQNRGWYGSGRSLFEEDNASVYGGNLMLEGEMFETPRRSPRDKATKPAKRKFGGAMVRAKTLAQPGYYMEAKIQASQTAMSSAFWLMTEPIPCEHLPQNERLELDIQECVGVMTGSKEDDWTRDDWAVGTHWERIFHYNTWRHPTPTCGFEGVWNEKAGKFKGAQKGGKVNLPHNNSSEFHIYGCYWHADGKQLDYFLDGELVKSIYPKVPYQSPMIMRLSSNFYDWVKEIDRESMGFNRSKEERSTKFMWVRTWKVK